MGQGLRRLERGFRFERVLEGHQLVNYESATILMSGVCGWDLGHSVQFQ